MISVCKVCIGVDVDVLKNRIRIKANKANHSTFAYTRTAIIKTKQKFQELVHIVFIAMNFNKTRP